MNKDEVKIYFYNIKIAYGFTQSEIANKIGVNRQYINAVYNGKKDLSTKSIHLLEQKFPDVNRTSNSNTVAVPYKNKVIHIDKSVLPSKEGNWEFIDVPESLFLRSTMILIKFLSINLTISLQMVKYMLLTLMAQHI